MCSKVFFLFSVRDALVHVFGNTAEEEKSSGTEV